VKFRMWFFSFFALLSFGWICYGLTAASSVVSDIAQTPLPTSENFTEEYMATLRGVGTTIGTGLGVAFFACTGLPLGILFSLLAWRNQVGYRNEQRHQQQMGAYERQVSALNQAAMSQATQASLAALQSQQQPIQGSDDAVKAQFAAAKALIQGKQYAQARALLKTINHPTAQEWLKNLDTLDARQ
jgi:hypothetical protein